MATPATTPDEPSEPSEDDIERMKGREKGCANFLAGDALHDEHMDIYEHSCMHETYVPAFHACTHSMIIHARVFVHSGDI